ncbi:uncharacterized protein [Drosophila takahashii]|uniref:uncharacterized protein n=1 Tax=Drosophila takahashii TaxID=29030 RepID=UPI001CF8FCDA|nr:E3 ubiquitin-protein ligase MIEL1 [Drosophila takahashii]
MVYLNLLVGLGVVLVAAATAIYFSQPTYQTPHRQPRSRNRRDEDEEEFDNGASLHRQFRDQRTRRSLPGDKCAICLSEMRHGEMRFMKCGHALDGGCFEEYRYVRRNCPLCYRTVNLSLPGDSCAICLDSLERTNMVHLRCQHALHFECHQQFIASGAKCCPLCREQL